MVSLGRQTVSEMALVDSLKQLLSWSLVFRFTVLEMASTRHICSQSHHD